MKEIPRDVEETRTSSWETHVIVTHSLPLSNPPVYWADESDIKSITLFIDSLIEQTSITCDGMQAQISFIWNLSQKKVFRLSFYLICGGSYFVEGHGHSFEGSPDLSVPVSSVPESTSSRLKSPT